MIISHIIMEVSKYVERANVGVLGANVVPAKEGAVILVHNTGNITSLISSVEKLIVISGIDKLVPDIINGLKIAKLVALASTGANPRVIEISHGPTRSTDIDGEYIRGAYGFSKLHIILVGNGRLKASHKI